MTLKVYTFIGRLIRHIPDKYFPMIRYTGLFCNRWKKLYLSLTRNVLNIPESTGNEETKATSWQERQFEYTGIDPLVCPYCEQPLVFVGYFFGNWSELQSVFEKTGYNPFIPEVLLRSG